jgi:hypothetical protein
MSGPSAHVSEPTASERRISAGNRSQRKGKRAARKLMAAAVAAATLVVVPRDRDDPSHRRRLGEWQRLRRPAGPHARHHALGSVDVTNAPNNELPHHHEHRSGARHQHSRLEVLDVRSGDRDRHTPSNPDAINCAGRRATGRPVGGPSRRDGKPRLALSVRASDAAGNPKRADHCEPRTNIKCALTIGAAPPVTCPATRQAH